MARVAESRDMKKKVPRTKTTAITASAGPEDALFARVVEIIETARDHVARSVNTAMVQAYWLIGREIVEVEQNGEKRAGYGERDLEQAIIDRLEAFLLELGKGGGRRPPTSVPPRATSSTTSSS